MLTFPFSEPCLWKGKAELASLGSELVRANAGLQWGGGDEGGEGGGGEQAQLQGGEDHYRRQLLAAHTRGENLDQGLKLDLFKVR